MIRNSVYYKGVILFIAFIIVLPFLNAETENTETETKTEQDFRNALQDLEVMKSYINREMGFISQYFTLKKIVVAMLQENEEDKRDNIFSAMGGKASSLTALGEAIMDEMDGEALMREFDVVNVSIEKFLEKSIVPLYERERGYNYLFERLQYTYDKLIPNDRSEINNIYFATTSSKKFDLKNSDVLHYPMPTVGNVFLTKCGGCWGYYPTDDYHKDLTCEGCNEDYFSCNKDDIAEHKVRYCSRRIEVRTKSKAVPSWQPHFTWVKELGICGNPYRNCDDPKKRKVHYYYVVTADNDYTGGMYLKEYKANSATRCFSITKPLPATTIYGSNGVGLSWESYDKSPDCPSCVDASKHCPDARSNHPKEVPGPVSFSLSHGAARGSIAVSWSKPDFDGFSNITDYEYSLRYKGSDGSYYLLKDWKSFGFVSYSANSYYMVLQTGLSKTRIQVTIRAVNEDKGAGTSLSYKYINTK